MPFDSFRLLLISVAGFIFVFLTLGWYIRRCLQCRALDRLLSDLPPEFSRIQAGDRLVCGPTGVWLVAGDWSGFSSASLSARAKSYSLKLSQKSGLSLQVLPVLVYPDSGKQTKYRHSVEAGTYLVSRKWLIRLITEDRPDSPDTGTLQRVREILSSRN